MILGYNTNGFAHHRLEDAIAILADLGYAGIALTPDVHHLDPTAPNLSARAATIRKQLEAAMLTCVVETGARFLLDPLHKHQPTLISPSPATRAIRFDFLKASIDLAVELGAGCVSFWSGAATDAAPPSELMMRLADGCRRLADHAAAVNVHLAFEPEPGMFISTMDEFAELFYRVNHPSFGLALDVGHLVCNEELPVSRDLHEWRSVLRNIHLDDMRPGIHDHLPFGEGTVDFVDVFAGLAEIHYTSGIYVELSRHSYDAVNTARKAKLFLDRFLAKR